MAIREQVPKPLRGPAGFASLAVMLLGIVVGYILTMVGITLYLGLDPIQQGAVSSVEAIGVTAVGIGAFVAGYLGWRGFNYFAY
ncbi:hypothetical protein [Halorussus sp. MSC15.2]|uniref:hypothetical protein n=1 Tax=Halorussus sp. MSC15.2 TaxID=2283638 RepID=UPI0013D05AFF|nr:hypothetical protein [Halorussus sp. MSC15.2]NEU56719.1 hypothetical protein [Halorussus sp. MSC15.2]